jgi:hypothetical protein
LSIVELVLVELLLEIWLDGWWELILLADVVGVGSNISQVGHQLKEV